MESDQTIVSRTLFSVPVIVRLSLALCAYVIVTEWLEVYPMGPPLPEDRVQNRATECILLWTGACWLYGWLCVIHGRGRGRTVPMLRFVLVPIVASLMVAGYNLWLLSLENAPTGPRASQLTSLGLVLALSPIVYGVVGSLLLLLQVRWWRRMCRTGFCAQCEYNLTGNTSGICPECGRSTSDSDGRPRIDARRRKLGGLLMMIFGLSLALFAIAGGPVLRTIDADRNYRGQQLAWAILGACLAALGLAVRLNRTGRVFFLSSDSHTGGDAEQPNKHS